MAVVLSVSVPEALHCRWKESELDISPSALFQSALETELSKTNQHLVYWSNRALTAEKSSRQSPSSLLRPTKTYVASSISTNKT